MLKIYLKRIVYIFLAVSLTACGSLSPKRAIDDSTTQEITRILEEVQADAAKKAANRIPPKSITDGLVPSILNGSHTKPKDSAFDIAVDNLAARQFFLSLVKGTRYNVVVHPEVEGKVTLNLNNVTVPETLSVVKDIYGYPVKQKGNLFTILPAGIRTEVFKIDYLDIRREGMSQTRVASGSVSDSGSSNTSNSRSSNSVDNNDNQRGSNSSGSLVGTYINTNASSDFWGELKANLELLVGTGEDRKIVVTPQSGIVIVRAMPGEIDVVRDFLNSAELIMRRQVILEAKILEVTLNDEFQSGVNWTALGRSESGRTNVFSQGSAAFKVVDGASVSQVPGGSGIPSADVANGIFGVSLNFKNFAGIIDLLENQGTVQVLSSPRISTVNNQKAVIKVGTDEFFVTEVSNTVTSGDNPVSSPSVELTPFFSGIALDVTPQISDNNDVILHVHPTISEVSEQNRSFSVASQNFTLPLAQSSIRESDSIIFAKSDQVVVIGGLIQSTSRDNDAATPWVSKIPVLGNFFKQRAQTGTKRELVILLRPKVMSQQAVDDAVAGSLSRFQKLHSKFKSK